MIELTANLYIPREFFVTDRLQIDLVLVLKGLPGAIPQGGRRNEQSSLAPLFHHLPDQFAADEGFAQTNGVCDQNAVVLRKYSFGAEYAVVLKRCQPDSRTRSGLLLQFIVVTLPKDAQVNQIRRISS